MTNDITADALAPTLRAALFGQAVTIIETTNRRTSRKTWTVAGKRISRDAARRIMAQPCVVDHRFV